VRDSAELFLVALDELGIDLSDADSALWRLAKRAAGDKIAGRVEPASGATELWRAYLKVRDNGDLRVFVVFASMLDDHPEDAEQLEADMVAAARDLLARPAPRRWIKNMAVQGRSPLTQTTGPNNIEVDLGTLPISTGLHSDIARWDAHFAAVLSDWPAAGALTRNTTPR
jgi:hypothetical protein